MADAQALGQFTLSLRAGGGMTAAFCGDMMCMNAYFSSINRKLHRLLQ
ncbi:hypothetical protein AALB53_12030 [Lachnospiraceae bacterium 47-T17]